MMFGGYRKGQEEMPRVIHISVARYRRDLPQPGEPLEFLLTVHEEGTGITWQQNVAVDSATEAFLVEATNDLLLWSVNLALTSKKAEQRARELGARLYRTFIGPKGEKVLSAITPTAILLDVDEIVLNLPWELITAPAGPLSLATPFGRLVSTRMILRQGRDPLQEDTLVRILAVANPTSDLAASEAEIATLQDLEGPHGPFRVELEVLARDQATRANFAQKLADGDYDMLHFGGHGFLDRDTPGLSALRFADDDLTADEVLELPWKKPPYFVFNSACESGRGVSGQRLVSAQGQTNGLAAAFLAAGVYGYAGYFWPVTEAGAGIFARTFYQHLFLRENVGLAFLEARRRAIQELGEVGDLTGYSAILYGDAASKHRRDLAMAA
jgi:CHAT domain-containing protein